MVSGRHDATALRDRDVRPGRTTSVLGRPQRVRAALPRAALVPNSGSFTGNAFDALPVDRCAHYRAGAAPAGQSCFGRHNGDRALGSIRADLLPTPNSAALNDMGACSGREAAAEGGTDLCRFGGAACSYGEPRMIARLPVTAIVSASKRRNAGGASWSLLKAR